MERGGHGCPTRGRGTSVPKTHKIVGFVANRAIVVISVEWKRNLKVKDFGKMIGEIMK